MLDSMHGTPADTVPHRCFQWLCVDSAGAGRGAHGMRVVTVAAARELSDGPLHLSETRRALVEHAEPRREYFARQTLTERVL